MNIILFVISFVFPGIGQMIKNDWKNGWLFYLIVVTNPTIVLASTKLNNDNLIICILVLLLLNLAVRIFSAIDAARGSFIDSKAFNNKFIKFIIIFFCLMITFILNSYGLNNRFLSFNMHARSSLLEPDLPPGTRILAAPIKYCEKGLNVGDFVIINQINTKKGPFIFKIHALAGEIVSPFNNIKPDEIPKITEAKSPSHNNYLVGASNSRRFTAIVCKDDIIGKALYVYWPLNKIRKF